MTDYAELRTWHIEVPSIWDGPNVCSSCAQRWPCTISLLLDTLAAQQERIAELERALVLAAIPLEALNVSARWELAEEVKVAIANALEKARKVLGEEATNAS